MINGTFFDHVDTESIFIFLLSSHDFNHKSREEQYRKELEFGEREANQLTVRLAQTESNLIEAQVIS